MPKKVEKTPLLHLLADKSCCNGIVKAFLAILSHFGQLKVVVMAF